MVLASTTSFPFSKTMERHSHTGLQSLTNNLFLKLFTIINIIVIIIIIIVISIVIIITIIIRDKVDLF